MKKINLSPEEFAMLKKYMRNETGFMSIPESEQRIFSSLLDKALALEEELNESTDHPLEYLYNKYAEQEGFPKMKRQNEGLLID
ncbi:MAG: hypothetical protein KBT03_02445 [Bacteroidales bacterium]|nr:hypothetical protein [Candidatus Scybalousia scybalohippi]